MVERLNEYTAALEAQLEIEETSTVADVVLPDISNKKIVVVGGHDSWQQKLKELYPSFVFIAVDDYSFDVDLVRKADIVLFNFVHSSHKLYYRLKANATNINYIANTNIDKFNQTLANVCK